MKNNWCEDNNNGSQMKNREKAGRGVDHQKLDL